MDRIRKLPKDASEDAGQMKLREQKFFQRLVEKEREKYEQYKENALSSMNTPQFLDESRYYEN